MSARDEYPFGLLIEAVGVPGAEPVVLTADTDAGLDDEGWWNAQDAIAARDPVRIRARSEAGLVSAALQFQRAVQEAGTPTIH